MGESSSFAKSCIVFTWTTQHDPSSSSPVTRIQLITVFFLFFPKRKKKFWKIKSFFLGVRKNLGGKIRTCDGENNFYSCVVVVVVIVYKNL